MAEKARTLPEYDRPPVFETVLGVQFNPLERFSIPHFGLYWNRIKREYPIFEVQPPIGAAFEKFGEDIWKRPDLKMEIVEDPGVRCWFIDNSRRRLIQVQKDRFIHNWRKIKRDDVYPRYDNIKPKFFEEWQGFRQFLEESQLDPPKVNQWEVTYVNHIELAGGPAMLADLNKIISSWSGRFSGDFLPSPESVLLNTSFALPGQRGRLHISLQPAIRKDDAQEILQLTLTARGLPVSPEKEAISDWFDLGHEWIVRGFTDFTTKEAHEMWGRTI